LDALCGFPLFIPQNERLNQVYRILVFEMTIGLNEVNDMRRTIFNFCFSKFLFIAQTHFYAKFSEGVIWYLNEPSRSRPWGYTHPRGSCSFAARGSKFRVFLPLKGTIRKRRILRIVDKECRVYAVSRCFYLIRAKKILVILHNEFLPYKGQKALNLTLTALKGCQVTAYLLRS